MFSTKNLLFFIFHLTKKIWTNNVFCDRYKVPKDIILNSFFTKFSVMYRNTGSSLDLGVLSSVWIIHRLIVLITRSIPVKVVRYKDWTENKCPKKQKELQKTWRTSVPKTIYPLTNCTPRLMAYSVTRVYLQQACSMSYHGDVSNENPL